MLPYFKNLLGSRDGWKTSFLLGWHFLRCERLVSRRVPFRCVVWISPNSRALNSKEQMLEVLTQSSGLKLFKTLGHDISNCSVDLKYLANLPGNIHVYILIHWSSTDSFLKSSVKLAVVFKYLPKNPSVKNALGQPKNWGRYSTWRNRGAKGNGNLRGPTPIATHTHTHTPRK